MTAVFDIVRHRSDGLCMSTEHGGSDDLGLGPLSRDDAGRYRDSFIAMAGVYAAIGLAAAGTDEANAALRDLAQQVASLGQELNRACGLEEAIRSSHEISFIVPAVGADGIDTVDTIDNRAMVELVRLLFVIAHSMELLAEGQIDIGLGYPYLAAGCDAARRGLEATAAGELPDALALRGAAYELETLLPVPSSPGEAQAVALRADVPLSALLRRTGKVTDPES